MSKRVRSRAHNDFSLTPRERATYGATITARDLETGKTRTFARINETAVQAVRHILEELDGLPGDWRVVTISTPVTIARDIYASRIAISGDNEGQLENAGPEKTYLAKVGRRDRLHPDYMHSGATAPYYGSTHQRNA